MGYSYIALGIYWIIEFILLCLGYPIPNFAIGCSFVISAIYFIIKGISAIIVNSTSYLNYLKIQLEKEESLEYPDQIKLDFLRQRIKELEDKESL